MACYHPHQAWRYLTTGAVVFGKDPPRNHWKWQPIRLPCNNCIGCWLRNSREWTLRCHLENQKHETASAVTLTFDDAHVPLSIDKFQLSSYIKRVRAASNVLFKFFATGEYGTHGGRPHYHAILFGLRPDHRAIRAAWNFRGTPLGNVHIDALTPRALQYIVGYVQKKQDISYKEKLRKYVDPKTGECITWQPPFRLMSRGGRTGQGLGAHAKRFFNAWRTTAVWQGNPIPVPRYYHAAWQDHADHIQKYTLLGEQIDQQYQNYGKEDYKHERLEAAEKIQLAKQSLSHTRRIL